ncbi:MAG TPA: hypothetical protein PKE69_00670 [Pyrinomonadaceae bacterium]|nr:hypothetical protein [Pyrinomonadaceae bacterium]
MLNKIYLLALAVFIFGMGFLTYMASDWLTSVSSPDIVSQEFQFWFRYGRIYLLITSVLLLALANTILWKTEKSWSFWTTLLYFSVFIILQTFWLDRAFADYKVAKRLEDSSFTVSPLIGVLGVIVFAAFVLINQVLVKRAMAKMSSKEDSIQELPEDIDLEVADKESEN